MKKILSAIILISILCLFNFCGDNKSNDFFSAAKEKGVQIFEINNKPKNRDKIYQITEILSLGGEEPIPILFQPRSCLVDENGNLFFTDEGRIKKFSPDGRFLRFIGDKGEGPGEINFPLLQTIIEDSLIVGQSRISSTSRYEIFSLNGGFLRRIYHPIVKKRLFPDARNYIKMYVGADVFLYYSSKNESRENGIVYISRKFGLATVEGKFLRELDFYNKESISNIQGERVGISQPLSMGSSAVCYQNIYILSSGGTTIYIYDKPVT